ncbi:hypothetical protein F4818DRAFT_400180, partial [Hypoxylon cercidicola]
MTSMRLGLPILLWTRQIQPCIALTFLASDTKALTIKASLHWLLASSRRSMLSDMSTTSSTNLSMTKVGNPNIWQKGVADQILFTDSGDTLSLGRSSQTRHMLFWNSLALNTDPRIHASI